MDTYSTAQRIVAIFIIIAGAYGGIVFANSVYIYTGDFDLPIPAAADDTKGWMTDAVIEVSDNFIIHDLDVGIDLTHTRVFDLQIFLQSPQGTRLCLNMYDFREYFEGENYSQTVFDDEANIPIEQGEAPFAGRFRPKAGNLLQVFDGQNSVGQWRLQIYDAFYYDTGNFNRLELTFTTPEPATAAILILGATVIMLFRPHPKP